MHSSDAEKVVAILKASEALRSGHYQYRSGHHGFTYIDKNNIYINPALTEQLAECLAAVLAPITNKFDVIAAPAIGGIIIAQSVARLLGKKFVFAKKDNGSLILDQIGFVDTLSGSNVVCIEDTITTGRTIHTLADLINTSGGYVVEKACLFNRSIPSQAVAAISLLDFDELSKLTDMSIWQQNDCPLCKAEIPLDN